ncbi:MAG: hypothetical protein QXX51_02985 [Candidatus Bathyarchaeia archaeon]
MKLLLQLENRVADLEEKVEELIDRVSLLEQKIEEIVDYVRE